MRTRQLLSLSHHSLASSRLIWWGALWSALSLLLFYWPGRLISGPWMDRLFGPTSFDPYVLRQPLLAAQESGVSGWLLLLFGLRLLLTPAIDAFVYGRLLQPAGGRFSPRGFYGLYLLEMMAVALVGWTCALAVWPSLLAQPPLLPVAGLLFALLAWIAGVCLSWQRARLAIGEAGTPQLPPAAAWLPIALSQAVLTIGFALVMWVLLRIAVHQQGVPLALTLIAAAALRTYGRLWKIAVVTEISQVN